jgi:hypothetical protein
MVQCKKSVLLVCFAGALFDILLDAFQTCVDVRIQRRALSTLQTIEQSHDSSGKSARADNNNDNDDNDNDALAQLASSQLPTLLETVFNRPTAVAGESFDHSSLLLQTDHFGSTRVFY